MSCSAITGGILDLCNDGFSGIDKVFIANGPVESFAETAGVVTAITVGGAALTPTDFFTFEVPRQTSSITETVTATQENGTLTFQQDCSMVFNHLSAEKRNQLLLIGQATTMVVVVKDNSAQYWSIGIENGAYLTAGTVTSGVAYSDRGGMEITVSGLERNPMFEVTSTIVEA